MEPKNMKLLAAEVLAADPVELADAIESIVLTMEGLERISPPHAAGVSNACGGAPETSPQGGGGFLVEGAFRLQRARRITEELDRKFKPKPLDFGTFRLSRFKSDGRVTLIGVSPANESKPTRDEYGIFGESGVGSCRFAAMRNGCELFTLQGASFARMEKLAVHCLKKYIGQNRHKKACAKRARAAKREGRESC